MANLNRSCSDGASVVYFSEDLSEREAEAE